MRTRQYLKTNVKNRCRGRFFIFFFIFVFLSYIYSFIFSTDIARTMRVRREDGRGATRAHNITIKTHDGWRDTKCACKVRPLPRHRRLSARGRARPMAFRFLSLSSPAPPPATTEARTDGLRDGPSRRVHRRRRGSSRVAGAPVVSCAPSSTVIASPSPLTVRASFVHLFRDVFALVLDLYFTPSSISPHNILGVRSLFDFFFRSPSAIVVLLLVRARSITVSSCFARE